MGTLQRGSFSEWRSSFYPRKTELLIYYSLTNINEILSDNSFIFFPVHCTKYHRAPGYGYRRFGFGRRPQYGYNGYHRWDFSFFFLLVMRIGRENFERSFNWIANGFRFQWLPRVTSFWINALYDFVPLRPFISSSMRHRFSAFNEHLPCRASKKCCICDFV